MYTKNKNNISKKIIYLISSIFFIFLFFYFSKISIVDFLPNDNKFSIYLKTNKDLIKENKNLKEKILTLEKEKKLNIFKIIDNNFSENNKEYFNFFNILSNEKDNIYNSMNIIINNKKIEKNNLVLSKNNNAIGIVNNIEKKFASIDYFSKENLISNLFLKNYFKDEIIFKIKKQNENNFLEKNKEDTKDGEEILNTEKKVKDKIEEKEKKKNKINEIEKEEFNKENILESFNIKTTGYGNGFLFIEVPRKYKISKDSVLFYLGDKKYPVAYFFEEKDSEQIPIKKIFYKMFENPASLDTIKIKK